MSEENNLKRSDYIIKDIKETVISYETNYEPDNDSNPEGVDDLPGRIVDFASLNEINSDAAFWLYIPDTSVDYPVMTGEYYLDRDIYGNKGSWGSLFTYREYFDNDYDMFIVYGHHVTGYDPAFGNLEKFLNETFAREHKTAYVYLPDGSVDIYRLFSVLDTDTNDYVYRYYFRTDTDRWKCLIDHLYSASVIKADGDADNSDKLMLLSTCKEYNTRCRVVAAFYYIRSYIP